MRLLTGIIIAAIAIQLASSMVPGINSVVATITTPTYNAGVVSIWAMLLLIFGAYVIIALLKQVEL